ncbi:MAG: hypothetical protein QOH12_1974 [Solirubrobacteraceae bacterium]|nr:hypothetical protein [Solirubrobacteraceae bacterium]
MLKDGSLVEQASMLASKPRVHPLGVRLDGRRPTTGRTDRRRGFHRTSRSPIDAQWHRRWGATDLPVPASGVHPQQEPDSRHDDDDERPPPAHAGLAYP